MAWKQALAKIKQDIKKEEPEQAPAPKPKPLLKPVSGDPRSIEEEDALFLAAMGGRPRPAKPAASPVAEPPPPPPPPVEPEVRFEEAVTALKGLKPIKAAPIGSAPEAPAPKPPPPAEPPPPVVEERPVTPPAPAPPAVEKSAHPTSGPRLIQLAAGMAIDVDGVLDLRAHSVSDARERLLERIQDSRFLGWRTLHVHLGPDAELAGMLHECIHGPAAASIIQYAQAPIPMGGGQAWILYFAASHA